MKVISKQLNSKLCMICGMENPYGIKAQFYNLEDGSVASLFEFSVLHQSYPNRTHGGVISALLDELIGRALWANKPNVFGVTTRLNVTYRKPVPYGTKLKARGYIINETSLGFSAKGEIYDLDDNVLAEAQGQYLKLSPEKITDGIDMHDEMCYDIKDDVTDIPFKALEK